MISLSARVAQMESNRFVGGSAQTQALPRAPNSIPSRGECSTVVIAPQLLSQVAAVDANSISINSIPDIARRAA